MRSLLQAVSVASVLLVSVADASVIQVDPSQYAPGTDISNVFSGVTLSNISDGYPVGEPITRKPIYATTCDSCNFGPVQGQVVFGHQWDIYGSTDGPPSPWFDYSNLAWSYFEPGSSPHGRAFETTAGRWNALLIEFDHGTDFVQLYGGGARNGNFFVFDVWGTAGNHLARCYGDLSSACGAVPLGNPEPGKDSWEFTITNQSSDIGFITAGGWSGRSLVHSLSYNKVPEPSTLGMFGAGLLGLGLFVRRRSRVR